MICHPGGIRGAGINYLGHAQSGSNIEKQKFTRLVKLMMVMILCPKNSEI